MFWARVYFPPPHQQKKTWECMLPGYQLRQIWIEVVARFRLNLPPSFFPFSEQWQENQILLYPNRKPHMYCTGVGVTDTFRLRFQHPKLLHSHSGQGFTFLVNFTSTYLHHFLQDVENSGSGKLPVAHLHNTVLTHICQEATFWCLLLTHLGQLFLIPLNKMEKVWLTVYVSEC